MPAIRPLLALLSTALLAAADCRAGPAAAPARPDLVFAAASLAVAMDELAPEYRRATGRSWRIQYAASGTLARQVEAGAAADVFISADLEWMDFLDQRGLLAAGTRGELLGNRLVLVAPADSGATLAIGKGFPLAAALGRGRLAIGDPDSVPAGRYARMALESLGAWAGVADHLVRADSVRTALAFVERGEAPLGVVYYTDARDDRRVRIVGEFPAASHAPIVYPAAQLRGAQPGSEALLAFLRSPAARAAFERHGFTFLPTEPTR